MSSLSGLSVLSFSEDASLPNKVSVLSVVTSDNPSCFADTVRALMLATGANALYSSTESRERGVRSGDGKGSVKRVRLTVRLAMTGALGSLVATFPSLSGVDGVGSCRGARVR